MTPDDIPKFTAEVLQQIAAGIELYNRGDPLSKAKYPEYVEMQLSITAGDEYHQFWVKVPFSSPRLRSPPASELKYESGAKQDWRNY